jgi:propionyl-CoA carboxylase beta chain
MGPEGAVNIIHRRTIAMSESPEEKRQELVDTYRETFANPYRAASLGYIDEVLRPEDTRIRLGQAFAALENKSQSLPAKKHGNLPL